MLPSTFPEVQCTHLRLWHFGWVGKTLFPKLYLPGLAMRSGSLPLVPLGDFISSFLAALSPLVPCRIYSFLKDLEPSFALETPVGAAPAALLPPAESEVASPPTLCQFGP